MPTIAYDVLDPAPDNPSRLGGGVALTISEPAAEAIRAAMAGSPFGSLVPEHLTLLRALAARDADSELRHLVTALERHGAVVVRVLNPAS